MPIPGSPASSETEPGTMPPPSTRSTSGNPVATRGSSERSPGTDSGRAPDGPPTDAGADRAVSGTVPHPPHPPQRPTHCAVCRPQDPHWNTDRDLAMAAP